MTPTELYTEITADPPAPTARTVPFAAKELRWVTVTAITDSGTTATDIIAYM